MNRRAFLKSSAALATYTRLGLHAAKSDGPSAAAAATKPRRKNKKGFMFAMLRSDTANKQPLKDRFQLLRDAGFAGVEVSSAMDQPEVLAARDAAGLEIPSVISTLHWSKPLSDPNPAARAAGLESLRQALRDAKAYGASSVLLVPAVVTKDVSYADAYTRSVAEIAKAVPLAESLGVTIAIENVWNRFLLSPLEAVAYVDSFKSPFVKWHFDVGNVVTNEWPEHWIRQLGPRIAKVHVKEYSRKLRDEKGPSAGFNVELMAGDSDWPVTMAALDAVGYSGWLIAEQYRPPNVGDAEWLSAVAKKMDDILAC
jgi:L-ribulose-5-phosphate 3-epimerase